MKQSWWLGPLVALGVAGPGVSWAQLANNLTIGNPKAMAMANAVTADNTGIDAVHYNPAALTKLKGRQASLKTVSGILDIRSKFKAPPGYGDEMMTDAEDPVANSSGRTLTAAMYLPGLGGATKVPAIVAPLAGVSINNPGSKFTFATNAYAPQALGYVRGKDNPARYDGREVVLQRLTYFSPTIAYQINDTLSAGLSIGFSDQAMGLKTEARTPNTLLGLADFTQNAVCGTGLDAFIGPLINVCGGDINPYKKIGSLNFDFQKTLSTSYNLGVLWEPEDWLAVGATYQSESRDTIRGHYVVSYSKDWQGFWQGLGDSLGGQILSSILPSGSPPKEKGKATLRLNNPDVLALGFKVRPFERWQFNMDVRWTDFSDWDNLEIRLDKPLDLQRATNALDPQDSKGSTIFFQRGYRDTISWAFGTQYDLSSRIQLRAGYEWRPSAIPKKHADVLIPIGDAHLYGLGFGYRWDKDTQIDVGVNYYISRTTIPANTSCNVNCSELDNFLYNPYAGLTIKNTIKAYILGLNYQTKF